MLEDYCISKRDRRSTLSVGMLDDYHVGRGVGKSSLLVGVLEDYCIGKRDRRSTLLVGVLDDNRIGQRVGKSALLVGVL